MKKLPPLFYCSFVLLYLCQFYSCIKPPPNFEPGDASNVYTACRVKKMTSYQTRLFSYNSNNDPVSVINSAVGTGNANLSFKYDNKKRLIEYSAGYGSTSGFEILHRYGYSQNRITTDTNYILGSYNAAGDPVRYVSMKIVYLQYDKLNRVVRDSIPSTPFPATIAYNYDQAGNLLTRIPDGDGFVEYDNKLNPHRTNKVWMFIDRDYSVNNPLKAAAYNAAGLPLKYSTQTEKVYLSYKFATQYIGPGTDLEYDCK